MTGGNVNDCTRLEAVMQAIRVPRTRPGRPRTRPDHILADKGYSSRAIRSYLRRRGIKHTIPERADQRAGRIRRGRPSVFDRDLYRRHNVIERCFNRLKQFRGIPPATTRPPVPTPPPSPSPHFCSGSEPL
ncbi:hypothetical protein GCM10009550_78880 [Actinocorallia libanotica]|uniref:Transposase IS4-like domain-containing protein n=1 Tax=Actinocorallia libanotica TaxID=46162 RepID=A0ABN1S2E3_9ACTN